MKRIDAVALILWAVLPPVLLLVIHGNFLLSIILYLVIPSIYFSIRRPGIIPRTLIISAAAMVVASILDYIAFLNNAWTVPTIFPFRLLEFIPIEDFLFVFFAAYVIISGFHYFYPRFGLDRLNRKRLARTLPLVALAFIAFLILTAFYPDALRVRYYDTWLLAIAFVLPSVMLIIRYPAYRKPLICVVLFQLVAMLPYELVADAQGFWAFPASDYLGMIHLLGQRFPVEEFCEWMLLMAPAVLGFNAFMAGGGRRE